MATSNSKGSARALRRGAYLVGASLLAGLAEGRAEPVELSFGVASATVVRGIALGDGAVDVHASVSHASDIGWRAAAGVTALHAKSAPRQWDTQLFWRLGYAHRITDDDWSAQLALARYLYPGSARLAPYYARYELGATLGWRDRFYVSVGRLHASGRPTGDARRGTTFDIVVRHALPSSFSAAAGLGRLREPGLAYTYGHLALDWRWEAAQAQLAYIVTDSTAKASFGPAAANRWAASLGWDF